MGELVRSQISGARETFVSRDIELAHDLARQDAEIDRLNRHITRRAVEIGDDLEMREWAIFMVLIARAHVRRSFHGSLTLHSGSRCGEHQPGDQRLLLLHGRDGVRASVERDRDGGTGDSLWPCA